MTQQSWCPQIASSELPSWRKLPQSDLGDPGQIDVHWQIASCLLPECDDRGMSACMRARLTKQYSLAHSVTCNYHWMELLPRSSFASLSKKATSFSLSLASKSALAAFVREREFLERVATLLPGEALVVMSPLSVNRYLQDSTPQVSYASTQGRSLIVRWKEGLSVQFNGTRLDMLPTWDTSDTALS